MATKKTATKQAAVKKTAKSAAVKKPAVKPQPAEAVAEQMPIEETPEAVTEGAPENPAGEKPKAKRVVTTLTEAAKRKLIRTLIKQTADKLEQDGGKTTMSDLIRLLSLEKELGKEKPTKITVQWIDPRTGKPWLKEN